MEVVEATMVEVEETLDVMVEEEVEINSNLVK